MTARKRRSVEEIVQSMQDKLERAKSKLAVSQSKADPRLAPLVSAIEALDREEIGVRKGLTTGPQSFASRRKSHELWLLEIQAAENLASVSLEQIKARKASLKAALTEFSGNIANGYEAGIEKMIGDTLSSLPPSTADLAAYQEAFNTAQANRKAFTQAKATSATEGEAQASA